MKLPKLISSVFILSFFNILDRALGFIFKIFLARSICSYNLGLYQIALSSLFVLLNITTSGIPLAISKNTARCISNYDDKNRFSFISSAFIANIGISLLLIFIIIAFQNQLSIFLADANSLSLLMLLLPAFFFSSFYAPFRGDIWGQEKYFSVSVLEVIEQVCHIIFYYILISLGCNNLYALCISLSMACFVSLIVATSLFFAYKGKLVKPHFFRALFASSTPITLSRTFYSLKQSFTSFVLPFLFMTSGFSKVHSVGLLASTITMAMPLLYIPITVIGSLSFALLPSISKCYSANQCNVVANSTSKALSFSICFSSVFIPSFYILGKEIGLLFFDDSIAGEFLHICCLLILPLSMENIASSVMNALDLENKRFINSIISSLVFFAILFCFLHNFNIYVLAFAFIFENCLNCVLHIRSIKKNIPLPFNFVKTLLLALFLIIPISIFTKFLAFAFKALPAFWKISICFSASFSVFFLIFIALDTFHLSISSKNSNLSSFFLA